MIVKVVIKQKAWGRMATASTNNKWSAEDDDDEEWKHSTMLKRVYGREAGHEK